jgi:lipopolysaccharide export system permease protein
MRILSRYLIKQHAAPFIFSLTALTGFMLLNQIARRLEQLVGKDLPWTIIVEFFALTIPYLVAMTISMSVLVAVLHTFSRLARDSEITAFRAGGISLGQLVWPVLVAAALVAVFAFLFGDQVLPRTNHRLRVLMSAIGRMKPTFALKEHVVNEVQPRQVFLRTAQIDPATFIIRDVTIYRFPKDGSAMGTIYADSGRILFAPNQEDLQLVLYHGTAHEFDRREPGNFQRTTYDTYVIGLPSISSGVFQRDETDQWHSDREMSTCALEDVVVAQRRQTWIAQRAAEAAKRNGLRALVGMPLIQPDTAAPNPRRSLYCQLLDWIVPQPLEAQDQRRNRAQPDSATTTIRSRANIPPGTLHAGSRTPRARFNEIRLQQDRERGHRMRAASHLVEFHKKYSIPAACLVFVLLGVPLALRFPGGLGMVIGAAMVIFAIYYVGLIAGESLANKLKITPFWAMWTPNVVFGIIGGTALWRMARQGINVRGGDRLTLWNLLRGART